MGGKPFRPLFHCQILCYHRPASHNQDKDLKFMKSTLIRTAVMVGILAAGLSGAAIANSKPAPKSDLPAIGSSDGKAWANRCDEMKDKDGKPAGKYCETFQRLSVVSGEGDKKQAQRVAEFAIGFPPADKGKASGVLILPLGVVVDSDIKIQIDDKDVMKFRVRYCDGGGCAAIMKLDSGLIDKMRKGKVMTVKAMAFNGKPVDVPFRLDGLGEALEAARPKG